MLGDQLPHDRRQDEAPVPVRLGPPPSASGLPPLERRLGSLEPAAAPAGSGLGRGRQPAAGGGGAAGVRRARRGGAGAARRRGARPEPGAAPDGAVLADDGELGADVDRLAFRHEDLGEIAGRRRGDLGVDLVGRHLEQRLVVGDRVADLLEPADDGPLGDRLAELRHRDVSQRGDPFL